MAYALVQWQLHLRHRGDPDFAVICSGRSRPYRARRRPGTPFAYVVVERTQRWSRIDHRHSHDGRPQQIRATRRPTAPLWRHALPRFGSGTCRHLIAAYVRGLSSDALASGCLQRDLGEAPAAAMHAFHLVIGRSSTRYRPARVLSTICQRRGPQHDCHAPQGAGPLQWPVPSLRPSP